MENSLSASELERLISTYGPAWRLFAARGSDHPDDLVQEALLKLMRQTTVPKDPAAWVFRVLRNLVVDQARQRKRQQQHQSLLARRHDHFEASAETAILDSEAIGVALDRLSEEELLLVVGRVWGGMTLEQLGELLDCSAATVMRRYRQVLEQLSQWIEPGQGRSATAQQLARESKPQTNNEQQPGVAPSRPLQPVERKGDERA